VSVELLHGPVGPTGELTDTTVVTLALVDLGDTPGQYRFIGSFTCERTGRYGISVRVVPSHPDLAVPADLGCVTWA
jgi:starch phosphorylase